MLEILLFLITTGSGPSINVENGVRLSPMFINYLSNETTLNTLDDFDAKQKEPEDAWFGIDKFWHWTYGFTLTGSSYHLIHNRFGNSDPLALVISISFTLSCSLLKEFYDLNCYNLFSYKDLIYDILGIITGYFVFIYEW